MPTADRSTNPMFGPNAFKLGLFGYSHDGGPMFSSAPERWRARWDDIETMARMADAGGLDFLMPLARWKGFRAKVDHQIWGYENVTQAAALAAITKRIAIFMTLHTPIYHPVLAAKALATVDHVSHGRAGLNIVCGWNTQDFDMFGLKVTSHDDRYQQGQEWFDLVKRILAGPEEEFDYASPYYPDLKGVIGQPGSIQQPHMATMSAAFSEQGREFAVRNADFLFLGSTGGVEDIVERARRAGQEKPPVVLSMLVPYIRETRKEAEAFYQHFAIDGADQEAYSDYRDLRDKHAATAQKHTSAAAPTAGGGYPLVGTPEDFVEQLVGFQKQGIGGATLTLPHYIDDLPILIDRVLPLMQQAGLRVEAKPALAHAAAK